MGRKILGGVLGALAGGITVGLVEAIGHAAFPPGPGFDPTAPDMSLVPVGAIASVAGAWCLAPLVGGAVATRLGRASGPATALVVGALFLAGDLFNLLAIASPWWLWVAGVAAPIPAAFFGFRLARPRE
jgi:hypothetical protein